MLIGLLILQHPDNKTHFVMKVLLDINDSKAVAFLNFVKSLDFIRIQSKEDYEEPTNQEIS